MILVKLTKMVILLNLLILMKLVTILIMGYSGESGDSVNSRPLYDLCHCYLGFCNDHLSTQIPERDMVQQCTHVGLETNSETEKRVLHPISYKSQPRMIPKLMLLLVLSSCCSQQGEVWPVLSPHGSWPCFLA